MIEALWKRIGAWIQAKPFSSFLLIVGSVLLIAFWGLIESRQADRNNRHANALCENLKLLDLDNVKANRNAHEGFEAMKSICKNRYPSVIAVIHK